MAYEQKNNEGSLFKNEQKEGKQPDYKGSMTIKGQQYWLSAWINKDKNGKSYMSLKAKEKDANRPAEKRQAAKFHDQPLNDETIPF